MQPYAFAPELRTQNSKGVRHTAGQGYSTSIPNSVTVLSSPDTFTQFSILAGQIVAMQWPIDNAASNTFVLAAVMSIQALGPGCGIAMPNAMNTGLGEKCLIFNAGSNTFIVNDAAGNTLAALNPGQAVWFALTNNLTIGGNWLVVAFGSGGSGSVSAAALAGPGLAVAGAALEQIIKVTQFTINYNAGVNDQASLLDWQGGAGILTLPLASSVFNGYYVQVRNSGTGTLAVNTSGTDVLNNLPVIDFNIGDSAFIVTDGVSWYTIGLGPQISSAFSFQIVSLSGQSGLYVLPSNQQGKTAYRFTGVLTGDTQVQVPNLVAQYWVDNETSNGNLFIGTSAQIGGGTSFEITEAARYVLYCDGQNVLNASTSGIGLPVQISEGGTSATTASAALINLGGTSTGIAVFTAGSPASAIQAIGAISSSDAVALALIL